jgi:hypothetical protein
VIAHHRIAQDIDQEDAREELEPRSNPFLSFREILGGLCAESKKKRTSDGASDHMMSPDAGFIDFFLAILPRHAPVLRGFRCLFRCGQLASAPRNIVPCKLPTITS